MTYKHTETPTDAYQLTKNYVTASAPGFLRIPPSGTAQSALMA